MGERTIEFFREQSILLTGATGTVGQVVLERLLRCAPPRRVYLLTRSRPKASGAQRILDLLQQPLFSAVHRLWEGEGEGEREAHTGSSGPAASECTSGSRHSNRFWRGNRGSGAEVCGVSGCRPAPLSTCRGCARRTPEDEILHRFGIQVMDGDLQKDNLGLSESDLDTLRANVTVVVNCAASINFDDPFPQLFEQNVSGALRVLQLARACDGVRSSGCFVHVSTAYANSNRRGVIEEKLYESDIDHEHTFSELNRTTGEEHQRLAEQLRVHYGHPNNYTFTKWLAEHLIGSRHGDLPTLIIRPSIIGSTYRTPFNGWTSAPQGFGALVALGAFGAFLRLPSDGKAIGDVIPADYVASASLRATVQMAGRVGRLEVMHVASSHANPVTWSELSRQAVKGFDKLRMYQIPQQYMISPRCVYTWCSSSWRYALMHALDDAALVLAQLLVSLLGVVFPALGKQLSKPVRFLCRRQNVLKLLHHFICNQWIFKTDKIRELAHREHDPDFPLDVENIKWEPWCIDYVEGLCRYSLIPTLERITKREKEQATHAPDKPTTTTTTHRDTDRDRDSPSSTSTSATTTSSTSLGMCNPCCQSSNHPPESPPPSPSPVVESDESSEGKGRSDGAPLMSSRKISGTTTEGDTMALPSDVSNDSIERACC